MVDSARQELRPAGRERLIVVEDDPVTRTMLVGYFSENNFDVVGAGLLRGMPPGAALAHGSRLPRRAVA
ncbi:hypothetical protein ACVWXQ_008011 [Bradyrhizobium sp. S3.14.4]